MSMEQLMAKTGYSEKVLDKEKDTLSEPAGSFDIQPEVKAKMSREEICKQTLVPGYASQEQIPQLSTDKTSIPISSVRQEIIYQADSLELKSCGPEPVLAVVICDEEMRLQLGIDLGRPAELVPWDWVYAWANDILEAGDDPLESEFEINIVMDTPVHWDDSPDDIGLLELLWIIDGIPPQGVGCDIMILMSGEVDYVRDGCAYTPNLGTGRHFAMKCYVAWNARLFQHECSHLFGPTDYHQWDALPVCVMGWLWDSVTPNYCSTCTNIINSYAGRFNDDPPVTVTSLDDSTGKFFTGVPIYINSNPAGITSKTLDLLPMLIL